MRHRKHGRQFSRTTSHRRAMLRALTANLVLHERIETTDAKAKELKRVAERVITRAVRLGKVAYTPHAELSAADRARRLAAQRQVGRFLRRFAVRGDSVDGEKVDLIEKVFIDLAKRFEGRPGGYTRMLRLGPRRGDNAPMALVEFVVGPGEDAADAGQESSVEASQDSTAPASEAQAEGGAADEASSDG